MSRVVLPGAVSEITFDGVSPAIAPLADSDQTMTADCRTDLLAIDDEPVGLSFTATAAEIVSGSPIDATVCAPIELDAGTHLLTSSAVAGFNVDRVVLAQPAATEAPAAVPPTATVVASDRDSRTVEVSACPTGCWVVLGEGYNTGWEATSNATGSLGEPTLVDGNANGWWLEPTTTPTTVTMTWKSQGVLNAALLASLVGVLAALALVLFDRRRRSDTTPAHAIVTALPELTRLPQLARPSAWQGDPLGIATVVVAAVGSALFIGWKWGVVAALICGAVRFTRRARLLGAIGLAVVVVAQLIVVVVVLRDRPYPNAGWPVRFEWLHPWTLLGVVLVAAATLFSHDAKTPDE